MFYAIIASSLSAILVLIIAPIIGVGHPILKFDDVSPAGDSEVVTHKDLANSVMYQVKTAVRIKNYSLFL
ncbi:MAG: hypothetical protein LWX55_16430 [Deltaproteobacteria bacterium]|nr:hypothetical protein [Deltaproteobacteria bacterium]